MEQRLHTGNPQRTCQKQANSKATSAVCCSVGTNSMPANLGNQANNMEATLTRFVCIRRSMDMPCSGRNHFFRRPSEWNSRRVCWVQNWRYPTHPSALEIVGPRRRPRHGKRVSTHPERGYPHFSPPGGRVGNLELPARVVKNCKPKWPHDFSLHLAHPH